MAGKPAPFTLGDYMERSVTELAFNRFIGLEALECPQVLRLPAGDRYLNHLGTVHASAQLALAEASSGEFLLRTLGPPTGFVPVVRRMEAKFRKPAHGEITSTVTTPENALRALRAELAEKRRAFISITVELYDSTSTHTLSASVEWFIAVRLPSLPSERVDV